MGRLAEMQRKLLEVRNRVLLLFRKLIIAIPNAGPAMTASPHSPLGQRQQMMGPEAMGLSVANFGWEDERTCRNWLCGTCPHILFTNTVSSPA